MIAEQQRAYRRGDRAAEREVAQHGDQRMDTIIIDGLLLLEPEPEGGLILIFKLGRSY